MAYQGDHVTFCGIYDFSMAHAVVVSGATWNPCGHMLLNVGGVGGWYFHIAEVRGRPRFMKQDGYLRYLKETDKREVSRQHVPIPKPWLSSAKLQELLDKQWTWFVVSNNCATFLEDVLQAGGSTAGLYSNCPQLERFN